MYSNDGRGYRIKLEDPAIDFPVYGNKTDDLLEVQIAARMLRSSRLAKDDTLLTLQKKTGWLWFQWEDVEAL